MRLLSTQNAKTVKGEAQGYLTAILYLASADQSGYEVCPNRSAGCTAMCLYSAGRGQFNSVQAARMRKTKQFFEARAAFMHTLCDDIHKHIAHAKGLGLTPCVRLNGTSDIPWERVPVTHGALPNVMSAFPHVQFYDYTKRPIAKRLRSLPRNYDLTFSRAEDNERAALAYLAAGGRVAWVFADALPDTWHGYPVTDGDKHDLRFIDPRGAIVGLLPKGKARRDISGFVDRSHLAGMGRASLVAA